ncbi:hypothetical protein [Maribacter halichondriae]|uniref:hypothetical protein n=1 Tax=Maribacter halichondriae TaxID=2980554 RepID=UPI0023580D52|nr:hypothetical protein [Maribacter sp. Hal144]
MMNNSLPLPKFSASAILMLVGLFVVSCGSYQQASYYDNDGIYADPNDRIVERTPQEKLTPQQKQEKNTYSEYFGQRADQYEEILEGEIFTDVDSYSSGVENDSLSSTRLTDYYNPDNDYQGYAGWGDNATAVNINIYDNGWNNWGWGGGFGWGWNDPWLWNNWSYGGGFGWGWNNPWRWNRWGWGGGYGWGWNNWGWGGGYGWGWNNPWIGNRWGWNNWGWGGRNYAYNNSRRGYYGRNAIAGNSSRNALRGRSNLNTRSNSTRYRSTSARSASSRSANVRSSRSGRNGIASRRTVGVDQNRSYRTSRSTRAVPRYNSSSRSNQSYRSTSPRSGSYRSGSASRTRTAPRTSAYNRSTSGSRAGSYRSSGSSSRTNQSYRSSSPPQQQLSFWK